MKLKITLFLFSLLLFISSNAQEEYIQVSDDQVQLIKTMPIKPQEDRSPDVVNAAAPYSNVTNFLGQAFANGGSAVQTGNTITRLVADNIVISGTAPFTINGFVFSVANLNAVAVSARPRVRFYLADGAGGGPGTYITGFSFNPISFTAGSVGLYVSTGLTPFVFNSTNIWMGMTFDNNIGATGATLAQMDLLGQGLYNPVDVGSSTDLMFVTTAAGSFAASNAAGVLVNFGGAPVANFGWELRAIGTVLSINRADTDPRLAGSTASWTVTFNMPMTGLTASNFGFVTTGAIAGAMITSVTQVNSTTWTVNASLGTGGGTIGLDLVNATGLSTTLTNTLPFVGQVYNVIAQCVGNVATVPPTNSTTYVADYECPDPDNPNFTNYFDNGGTPFVNTDDYLLLSIDKLTNPDMGHVGDGTFSVQIAGAAGATWITNPPADYVIDPLFIVMNRWWDVTPNCATCASQPNIDADANVRFYFTQQDYDDVVSALILGGAAPLDIAQSPGELYMYKINDLPGPYDANPANAHSGVPQAFGYNEDGYWEYEPGGASSDLTWGLVVNDYTGSNFGAEITVVAFSGGGGGGGSNGSGALPIELLYFTGHPEAQANVIEWATATEKNNQYQVIERSADGSNGWSEIGRVNGAGTSTEVVSYMLNDENPLAKAYYRLRAMDFGGQEQLSEVIFIARQSEVFSIVNAFPIPVEKEVTVLVNSSVSGKTSVFVSDNTGKVFFENTVTFSRGVNEVKIDMEKLPSGTYYIRLDNGVATALQQLVKR